MTGFAYPNMLVRAVELFEAGLSQEAEDLYDLYLPLLRHELQPGIGLAIRKYLLWRQGAIASPKLRAPGPKLDATDREEIDALLARLEHKLGRAP
jgi:4-hydroxy-tetrahydrodipicolinate synthase